MLVGASGELFWTSPTSILAPEELLKSSLGTFWKLLAAPWELIIYSHGGWIVGFQLFGNFLALSFSILAIFLLLNLLLTPSNLFFFVF